MNTIRTLAAHDATTMDLVTNIKTTTAATPTTHHSNNDHATKMAVHDAAVAKTEAAFQTNSSHEITSTETAAAVVDIVAATEVEWAVDNEPAVVNIAVATTQVARVKAALVANSSRDILHDNNSLPIRTNQITQ